MVYWVKVEFERNKYLVNLDQISAFVFSPNGKITFWLPDSCQSIVVQRNNRLDDYQKILNYIKDLSLFSLGGSWLKIIYDRNEYIVDLNRISSFCYSANEKITFWLPEAKIPIVVTKQSDPEGYQKIIAFVMRTTGQNLS
jgi:hypothetical protein